MHNVERSLLATQATMLLGELADDLESYGTILTQADFDAMAGFLRAACLLFAEQVAIAGAAACKNVRDLAERPVATGTTN